MRKTGVVTAASLLGVALLLAPAPGRADAWDVRREIAEGNREIRREVREARREIANADSPWEVRQDIREAHREISREVREKRREVRREVNQAYWGW